MSIIFRGGGRPWPEQLADARAAIARQCEDDDRRFETDALIAGDDPEKVDALLERVRLKREPALREMDALFEKAAAELTDGTEIRIEMGPIQRARRG